MKQIKITLILFIINGLLFSQQQEIPKLMESDITGLKITREQSFDGSGLWGYINGGADIFLEYGFDKLLLQEFSINGLNFKVEIYKMNSPASAFGIYSVSHYKCEDKVKSVKYSCKTQYQIQCAIDCYYISIINANGSKEEMETSNKIFNQVTGKISGNDFSPPRLFNSKLLSEQKDQIKYFKGILGVQNGMMEWYDYFDGLGEFEVCMLPAKLDGGDVNIAQIKFHSGSDVNTFLKRAGIEINPSTKYSKSESGNNTFLVKMLNNNEMIFVEGSKKMDDFEGLASKLLQ
jgi:hypothetical protein